MCPGSPELLRVVTRSTKRHDMHRKRASPWWNMEELLYDIRLYTGNDKDELKRLSPRQWPGHTGVDARCRPTDYHEGLRPWTQETEILIQQTKTRLRTMLSCQYSFGSVVGAPVIFFLGGFVFTLLQSLEALGDENIAEGLAFGQWYMVIPHIAIVSSLLLAGNNPNILEGVFATEREDPDDDMVILGIHYELAYPSCYKVAWQSTRGQTKKDWIDNLVKTYGVRDGVGFAGQTEVDEDINELEERTTLGKGPWAVITVLTLLLIGVPFGLAFATSYLTPSKGLACRSLTILIYACAEFSQVLLWLWAFMKPLPKREDLAVPPSLGINSHTQTPKTKRTRVDMLSWLREGGP